MAVTTIPFKIRLDVEEGSITAEVADCPRCGPNLATHVTAKIVGYYGFNECMEIAMFDAVSCDYCGWSTVPNDHRPHLAAVPRPSEADGSVGE